MHWEKTQASGMRKRLRRSKLSQLVLLASFAPTILSQGGIVGKCFKTISEINTEMQNEQQRIAEGGTPEGSYTYILCSDTFFDATNATLVPLLDNVMFMCGDDGDRLNSCVVLGGTEQVQIQNSNLTGYAINQISFMGITFAGFEKTDTRQGTSITASASASTVVKFTDTAWQEFTSDFVIRQVRDGGASPSMTVEVDNSSITGGTCGSIFDNDRGTLRVTDLQVSDVKAASLMATANTGTSFLDQSTISRSEMEWITYTTAAATQTITNTIVNNMKYLEDTFYVEDQRSSLAIQGLTIQENNAIDTQWNGIVARNKATANISDLELFDNSFLRFGVISFDSIVTISNSTFRQNRGVVSLNTTSAPIFAITDATVNLDHVIFSDNEGFSGEVIALIRSNLDIKQSCFQSGDSEYVAFIGADSTHQQAENFIDKFNSVKCPTGGPRLFLETVGSSCFQGGSQCEGQCQPLADQTTCRAGTISTATPTVIQTPIATTTPSNAPVASSAAPTFSFPTAINPTKVPVPSSPGPTSVSSIPPSNVSPMTAVPVQRPVGPVFRTPTQPPTIATVPSTSTKPTILTTSPPSSPRASPIPSDYPSSHPSQSAAPTVSHSPTANPTISSAPTISGQPSNQPSLAASDLPSLGPSPSPTENIFKTEKPSSSILKSSKKKCPKNPKSKNSGKGKVKKKGKGGGNEIGNSGKWRVRRMSKSKAKGKGKGKTSELGITKDGSKVSSKIGEVPDDDWEYCEEHIGSKKLKSNGKGWKGFDLLRGEDRPIP